MSLNLQNECVQAIQALRTDPRMEQFRKGLTTVVTQAMNQALSSAPDQRVDATAYARALRDFWVAVEAASTGTAPNQIAKPGPLTLNKDKTNAA